MSSPLSPKKDPVDHAPHQKTKTLAAQVPSPLSVSIDFEKYLSQLEHSNASDEDKRELIAVLWNILASFVDLGFGIHTIRSREVLQKNAAHALPRVIYSKHTQCRKLSGEFGGLIKPETRKESR